MNPKTASGIVTTMGIDIGKNTFHLIGMDARGARSRRANAHYQRVLAFRPLYARLPRRGELRQGLRRRHL